MSPKFHSHLQTLVVRDVIVVVIANYCICDFQVTSEYLVKVSSLSMSLCATWYCWGKVASCQGLTHHRDVVVEVPTDDDRGMRVLFDDILGDIDYLLRSVLQLLLFPCLNVAVEDLDHMVGDLQLGPAPVCTHGLDQ